MGSERLGTVCVGCWKDIENDEEIFYDSEDQPLCEDCYERLVGFDNEDVGSVRRDKKRIERV